MANLDEKNSFKESKLFLPMVVGGAFVLGLGTTFLVLNNKEQAPEKVSAATGSPSASPDSSEGSDTRKSEPNQPILNKVLGKAPSEPDEVPGGVKLSLDSNYGRWVEQYVYTDLENIVATPTFGSSSNKVPSQYFEEMNMSSKLWANNGNRIIPAEGETVAEECDTKRGEFESKPNMDDIEVETVGVVAYPVSKKHGPHKIDQYYRSCFEYSTEGAVLAAANHILTDIVNREFQSDDIQKKYFYSNMRNSLKKMKFTFSDLGAISTLSRKLASLSVDAFRIDKVDASGANVMIYITIVPLQGDITLRQVPMTMVWEKGDWRIGRLEDSAVISTLPSNVSYFGEFYKDGLEDPYDEGPYVDEPGYGNDAKAAGAGHS